MKITVLSEVEEILISNKSDNEIQRLRYEAFSGDWAFATFSDDGSTIVVLEPYYVTVYRQLDEINRYVGN